MPTPSKHSPCVGIRTCSDYSPFGVELEGRTVSDYGYRFGYQGSEKDDEFKGNGNSYTTEFRQLDPRLGRWLSVDALTIKFPQWSSYVFCLNNPIYLIDEDGKEGVPVYISPKSGYTYWPKLKAYQWYTIEGYINMESFNKAAEYNLKYNNSWAYTKISERNEFYNWADKKISNKSRWFAAAEVVTRSNAVGAAEGINFWWLSDEAEKFLKQGNKFLFSYNMANAKSLINNGRINGSFIDANGSRVSFNGKTGRDLDYALVQFEQTKVQEFIEQYKNDHPNTSMKGIMESINYSMGSSYAPDEIVKVMDENFNVDNGQKAFNFENYNDRVKLGQKLIDQFYQNK